MPEVQVLQDGTRPRGSGGHVRKRKPGPDVTKGVRAIYLHFGRGIGLHFTLCLAMCCGKNHSSTHGQEQGEANVAAANYTMSYKISWIIKYFFHTYF